MQSGGISGANAMSAQLLSILMEGMKAQQDLSLKITAIGVEQAIVDRKNQTALDLLA